MISTLKNSFTRSLFPVSKFSFSAQSSPIDFSKYDPSQTKFLDEDLILVDENDKVLNRISKVDGHLNTHNSKGPAHRAFSVFLFNKHNQLLIHQRSKKKITFPLLWTNSCCSHPLYTEKEMIEKDYIGTRLIYVLIHRGKKCSKTKSSI